MNTPKPIESLDEILVKTFAKYERGITFTKEELFSDAKQAIEAYITEQVRLARIEMLEEILEIVKWIPYNGGDYDRWETCMQERNRLSASIAQLQSKEQVDD
jgi:hypothetical protein